MIKGLTYSIAIAGLLTTAACTGEFTPVTPGPGAVDGGGPITSDPKALYDSDVQPLLEAKCASCHVDTEAAPGNALKFMGQVRGDNYYATLNLYSEITGGFGQGPATLLTKGPHSGSGWWTDAEEGTIQSWLDAEATARADTGGGTVDGGGGGDTNLNSRQLLAEWSGCMTKDNWDASGMGDWSEKRTNNSTECASCHADGLARFQTNRTNEEMFQANRYELFIIGFFTVKLNPDGSGEVIPAFDKLTAKGDGSTNHPIYNVQEDDEYFLRLQEFYDLTMLLKEDGGCGPAEFPQT